MLLVPWLLSHSLLCVALGCVSLYYLVLFVDTECPAAGGLDCTSLLAYASTLVAAIVVLMYSIYLVQDFFDVLKYTTKTKSKTKKNTDSDSKITFSDLNRKDPEKS